MQLLTNLMATVTAVFGGKATVNASFGERVSDVLSVAGQANSFKRHFVPRRVGEQVVVVGGKDSGVVVGSVFHDGCKEPEGSNDTTEVIAYENGGRITVDTSSGTIHFSGFAYVFDGDVSVNGNLSVSGSISDSVGTLTDHTHTGVQSGESKTGGR